MKSVEMKKFRQSRGAPVFSNLLALAFFVHFSKTLAVVAFPKIIFGAQNNIFINPKNNRCYNFQTTKWKRKTGPPTKRTIECS